MTSADCQLRRIHALVKHQIPPHRICFEVTDTVAISELSSARLLRQELKDFGYRLALDDFDSRMSSFQCLRTLPGDALKIDGGLIREVTSDHMAREMVTAIVKIGHGMGLKIITEWVENDEGIDMLSSPGNDYLQGLALHQPELLLA